VEAGARRKHECLNGEQRKGGSRLMRDGNASARNERSIGVGAKMGNRTRARSADQTAIGGPMQRGSKSGGG